MHLPQFSMALSNPQLHPHSLLLETCRYDIDKDVSGFFSYAKHHNLFQLHLLLSAANPNWEKSLL